ncbi:hypothetical protein [Paraburkholderia sp. C35]|uniref:hypothetical protein n=1 Tax=Paraburkholderia sp. C35 TaxID=2126993 RepID=UPI000D69E241|nr:hypothetical protein [Paraburkholderia sp. C35]
MKFNDTAPVMPATLGGPPWLDKLADNATMEATVFLRPLEGKENIRHMINAAREIYEFQDFIYKGDLGDNFFFESYRSSVQGKPIEAMVMVHMNEKGEADSLVINHRPIDAAVLFSKLMHEKVKDRFGDEYLLKP